MSFSDKRVVYWDWFENKFITSSELDKTAPPERYTYVGVNNFNDIYVETWELHNGMSLGIAYTQEEVDKSHVDVIRHARADNYNVTLKRMLRWYIPKECYDKILEEI